MDKSEKRKKVITLTDNVQKMINEMANLTGSTDNQVIAMAIAVLHAQIIKVK